MKRYNYIIGIGRSSVHATKSVGSVWRPPEWKSIYRHSRDRRISRSTASAGSTLQTTVANTETRGPTACESRIYLERPASSHCASSCEKNRSGEDPAGRLFFVPIDGHSRGRGRREKEGKNSGRMLRLAPLRQRTHAKETGHSI